MPIGYQLYSARNAGSLDKTLDWLVELGYRRVEAYGDLLEESHGLQAELERTGLTLCSSHVALSMIEDEPARLIERAEQLGLDTLFVPHLAQSERPADEAGWRAFGERLARAVEPLQEADIRVGWHNHDFEFQPGKRAPQTGSAMNADGPEPGSLPIRWILDSAPGLAWQADIGWIVRAGVDPLPWLERYRERLLSVHVKDLAPPGECLDEDGWADPGTGTIDWAMLCGYLAPVAIARANEPTPSAIPMLVAEHDNPSDARRFARQAMTFFREQGLVGGSSP